MTTHEDAVHKAEAKKDPVFVRLLKLWAGFADHLPSCPLACGSKLRTACDCELLTASEEFTRLLVQLVAWRVAVIDATVVDFIFTKEHETNPRKAVNDLICWAQKCALDPAISKDAAALHEKIQTLEGIVQGLKDVQVGKVKTLTAIDAELEVQRLQQGLHTLIERWQHVAQVCRELAVSEPTEDRCAAMRAAAVNRDECVKDVKALLVAPRQRHS